MALIEHVIYGLKCDAPKCDYRDDTARYEDYPTLLNKPCPNCGGNLLTQKDLDTCIRIFKITAWINKWFGWLEGKNGKRKVFELDMDGSGKVDFKDKGTT